MAVLGINSRADTLAIFHSRHCEINFSQLFERGRRARIDAENGHRRVTRPRLRITVKETRGSSTGYLRVQSGTVKYGRGPLKVVSGLRADYETVYGYCLPGASTSTSPLWNGKGNKFHHMLEAGSWNDKPMASLVNT